MADLGRWLNGEYRVAGNPVDAREREHEDVDDEDVRERP